MDQCHFGRVIGEIECFLNSGIATADNGDFLTAVEEPVTRGTGRHAKAHKLLFGRQAKPARLRTGGDDDCVGNVNIAGISNAAKRPYGEVDLGNQISVHLGADRKGLTLHLLHQPGALDHFGKARIVFNIGRNGHLATGFHTGHQMRLEVCPRCIDRGGVPGRAGTND